MQLPENEDGHTEHLQYNNSLDSSQNDLKAIEVWPTAPKTSIKSSLSNSDLEVSQQTSTIKSIALFIAGLLSCYYIASYICVGLLFVLRVPVIVALLITLVIIGVTCIFVSKNRLLMAGIIAGALLITFFLKI